MPISTIMPNENVIPRAYYCGDDTILLLLPRPKFTMILLIIHCNLI